jgi:hypothetical protein
MPSQKQKLKKLIKDVDFINDSRKEEWLLLVDTLNDNEIKAVYKHFSDDVKKENDFMMKLLVKAGLQDEYIDRVKKISEKYVKKAKNKEKNK